WSKVYTHWLKNIRDWCISRQLWWGHRIPAWYCGCAECDEIYVGLTPPDKIKCKKCGCIEWKQDEDVLDTWFSSWLWPFATLGWPNKTAELKKFYPTSDLVTGPDIIFFWVARMIMAGFEFMDERPFDNVYFTGIIRDSQGRKMSKSLGNSPDPLNLIDKYGADGLRFGLMLIAPKGQDILFSEDRIEVGRNFMNKLWNASRFVMMNLQDGKKPTNQRTNEPTHTLADKWILNRLQHTLSDVNKALDHYQFDTAAQALYQFVWGDFCDWYLELAKNQMQTDKADATRSVLIRVLDNILRMLHPFAPFITEEIWQMLQKETIMLAEYPKAAKKVEYEKESREMISIMEIISAIRNIRGEHNVPPAKAIDATLRAHSKEAFKTIEHGKNYIKELAKLAKTTLAIDAIKPEKCATAIAGNADIFIPLAGMINVEDEKTRLMKEIERLEKYIQSVETKLANKNFVERAPKEVVDKERARIVQAKTEHQKLAHAVNELSNL
ncbi:MAG: class I tRNA ligase family protein, partial [Deltaproteobacteria bacterium]|nr:class I tRNA ligase family protein [Deltaproteobacteria bacterium]